MVSFCFLLPLDSIRFGLCVNQLIYMIIIFCKVYIAGAAGINAVNLLYLALCRLLLHDRLLSLGLGLLFGFRLGLLRLLAGCTCAFSVPSMSLT